MRAHAKWCSSSCSAAGYRAKNPDAQRNYWLKSVYGITAEQYDAMFAAQGECCAICRDPNPVQWNVDHCHETGAVRGILCSACNQGIGLLRDDREVLRSAVRYLSKSRSRRA